MAKKSFDYYDAFQRHAVCGKEASEYLKQTFLSFDSERLPVTLQEIHVIENKADDINHEVAQHLRSDFVTPLERDDISRLANNLDSVVDEIEDILMAFYMFHITRVNHHMVNMCKEMLKATDNLCAALDIFPRFKKASEELGPYLTAVKDAEEACDKLYLEAMYEAHDFEKHTAEESICLTAVYNAFEYALDALELCASCIEEIVTTNL